jgi:hypothetical protein
MDAEPTKLHWKRGRWYRVGGVELCIAETTIRGFVVLERPAFDTTAETGVESQAAGDDPPTI